MMRLQIHRTYSAEKRRRGSQEHTDNIAAEYRQVVPDTVVEVPDRWVPGIAVSAAEVPDRSVPGTAVSEVEAPDRSVLGTAVTAAGVPDTWVPDIAVSVVEVLDTAVAQSPGAVPPAYHSL